MPRSHIKSEDFIAADNKVEEIACVGYNSYIFKNAGTIPGAPWHTL